MTLFTKEHCSKCDFVKKHVDLGRLGVQVEVLGPENPMPSPTWRGTAWSLWRRSSSRSWFSTT